MKVRVTLMTENDKPVEVLGEDAEEKVKMAWDKLIGLLNIVSKDTAYVESVEILRGENDED